MQNLPAKSAKQHTHTKKQNGSLNVIFLSERQWRKINLFLSDF